MDRPLRAIPAVSASARGSEGSSREIGSAWVGCPSLFQKEPEDRRLRWLDEFLQPKPKSAGAVLDRMSTTCVDSASAINRW